MRVNILHTDNLFTTTLIRIMVGVVFLSEGIQKFMFPSTRGAGRFENIGLPAPDFLGGFVGSFEVICGTLVLLGMFTRLATVPLITIMIVALATTKIDILLNDGFWNMMHAARTDWAMLLGSIFLLLRGGGALSIDRNFFVHRKTLSETK
ncbi:MAG: DoxX family protein [Bacteroidales bacterium]